MLDIFELAKHIVPAFLANIDEGKNRLDAILSLSDIYTQLGCWYKSCFSIDKELFQNHDDTIIVAIQYEQIEKINNPLCTDEFIIAINKNRNVLINRLHSRLARFVVSYKTIHQSELDIVCNIVNENWIQMMQNLYNRMNALRETLNVKSMFSEYTMLFCGKLDNELNSLKNVYQYFTEMKCTNQSINQSIDEFKQKIFDHIEKLRRYDTNRINHELVKQYDRGIRSFSAEEEHKKYEKFCNLERESFEIIKTVLSDWYTIYIDRIYKLSFKSIKTIVHKISEKMNKYDETLIQSVNDIVSKNQQKYDDIIVDIKKKLLQLPSDKKINVFFLKKVKIEIADTTCFFKMM